jgi:hypothetical protein
MPYGVWIIKVLILLIMVPGVQVHLDNFPRLHTYGVSIGTNTDYCSAESVNGHMEYSCQEGN